MKKIQPISDRNTVLAVPVPLQTDSYTPVSAKLIFDTVDKLSKEFEISIDSEEFLLFSEGRRQRMRFFFHIGEFTRELVIINSYDKHIALKAASGASVFVCSNGVVVGDIKIYRRHTGTIDLEIEQFLRGCFEELIQTSEFAEQTKSDYSGLIVSKVEIARILGELWFDLNLLTSSQLNVIQDQFKNPSFNYGADPMSFWTFYNHVTYSLKNTSPDDYLEKRLAIQKFFAEYFTLPF